MSTLSRETLEFIHKLNRNNNRSWFDENRGLYQNAKSDFERFVQSQIDALQNHWDLGDLQAKDCIYRIFKDVRFSKYKTPYKAEFGASIAPGGKKSTGAGVHIYVRSCGKSFVDIGTCHLQPEDLKKIRSGIEHDSSYIHQFRSSDAFKTRFGNELKGEQVKTAPKGYQNDHPEIELLRYKNFSLRSEFETSKLMEVDFREFFMDTFISGKPLIDFINSAIEEH